MSLVRLQVGLPAVERRGQWSKRDNRLHRPRGIRERNMSAGEVRQAYRVWRRRMAPQDVDDT